jgi:sugar lactone lactonase YvrE
MSYSCIFRSVLSPAIPVLLAIAITATTARSQTIQTIAGTGENADGGPGGPALQTNLVQPFGVELGPDGALYICEFGAHRIRRLDLKTKNITNVAGIGKAGYSGDGGPATAAALDQPHELRLDREGNIYFTDMRNHAVRKIAADAGAITTIAGTGKAGYSGDRGPANNAQLNQPHSIFLDADRHLYIADTGNHRVRRVDLSSGTIDTIAGSGEKRLPREGIAAATEPLFGPRAICIADGELWIALREGHSVWRMNLKTGNLRHVAGNGKPGYKVDRGSAKDALLNSPKGIGLGPDGRIYVVDSSNHCLRAIDPKTETIETIAGTGGTKGFSGDGGSAAESLLNNLHGVGFGLRGEIFIGDSHNHRVRVILPRSPK